METMYMLTGVMLFVMGLFALFSHRHLLRKILAMNVMGSGVFMILIAAANRGISEMPDPVPHAMVLTGIVVAISATTLALAIGSRLSRATGQAVLPDQSEQE